MVDVRLPSLYTSAALAFPSLVGLRADMRPKFPPPIPGPELGSSAEE